MSIIIYALVLLAITFGVYLVFSWAILYHILKYGFKPNINRQIALLFAFVMVALSVSVLQKFFSVDWDAANFTDFLAKSNLNIFIGIYGQ